MADSAHILIADDDDSLRLSLRNALECNGYVCDDVPSAWDAGERLAKTSYDLLIADFKMPGNADLQLVRRVQEHNADLPVIIMTGHPTFQSAVDAVQLPVAAYLVKPVSIDELMPLVDELTQRHQIWRIVQAACLRIGAQGAELQDVESALRDAQTQGVRAPKEAAVDVLFRIISNSLSDLLAITESLVQSNRSEMPEAIPNDPRIDVLAASVREAVATLQKTKRAFKSDVLGQLREKLELYLSEVERRS